MTDAPTIQVLSQISIRFAFTGASTEDTTSVIFTAPNQALILSTFIDFDLGEARVSSPVLVTPDHPNKTLYELMHTKLCLQGGNPPPFGKSR